MSLSGANPYTPISRRTTYPGIPAPKRTVARVAASILLFRLLSVTAHFLDAPPGDRPPCHAPGGDTTHLPGSSPTAQVFLRLLAVQKRPNTGLAEILRALRVQVLEAGRARRIRFWLLPPGRAVRPERAREGPLLPFAYLPRLLQKCKAIATTTPPGMLARRNHRASETSISVRVIITAPQSSPTQPSTGILSILIPGCIFIPSSSS